MGVVALTALVAPALAQADIGITRVSPTAAAPGKPVTIEIGCGWPKGCPERIPISVIAADKAPKPHPCEDNALCSPTSNGPPRKAPYVFLGRATETPESQRTSQIRAHLGESAVLHTYELRTGLPNLDPGAYAFVAYAPLLGSRGKGTLITSVSSRNPFRVTAKSNRAGSAGNSHTGWLIAALGAAAIVAAAMFLRRRSRTAEEPTPSVSTR